MPWVLSNASTAALVYSGPRSFIVLSLLSVTLDSVVVITIIYFHGVNGNCFPVHGSP